MNDRDAERPLALMDAGYQPSKPLQGFGWQTFVLLVRSLCDASNSAYSRHHEDKYTEVFYVARGLK